MNNMILIMSKNKYLIFMLLFLCIQAYSQTGGAVEGEGLFDPCHIEGCEEVCDDVLGESHFEDDLRWLYGFAGENADTADLDNNRMLDVVQAWLLDEVLRDKGYAVHCCVKNVYRKNVEASKAYADVIQAVQPVVFLIIDRTKFEGVIAGLTTVGEKSTIDMLLGMIDELPIEVPMPDMETFDLSMSRYLSIIGDADMDGACNMGEYNWALNNGLGVDGYKHNVLDASAIDNGGGCVWCGEGASPEGEGIWEGFPEGTTEGEGVMEGEGVVEGILEGIQEGEGMLEGEGIIEGTTEGILEGEGMLEGEGVIEGEGLFDPCHIEGCEEVCDDVLGESHFEDDLRWLYEFAGENADTADLDNNRMLDVVQAWLLDEVLRDKGYAVHCCVKNVYRKNVEASKAYADVIQAVQPVVFLIIDRTKFEGVISGLTTVGEKSTIDMLLGMIDELPIEVPMPDMETFDLSMSRYLSIIGDADIDGACNMGEYRWALINGLGIDGYKHNVLDASTIDNGGGCVWCGEGASPEGEGIWEGFPEGTTEGEGEGEKLSSLTVIITPEEAILNGAQWQIEGNEIWNNSGDKVENLYAGNYKVTFSQPIGWSTSEYIIVEIGEHEDKVIEVKYWESGGILIHIYPYEVVNLGAKWKVINQMDWLNPGELIILPLGWYDVVFSDIEGYVTPSQRRLYIPHGAYLNLNINYRKETELDKKQERNLVLQIWSTFSYCDIDGDDYLTYEEIVGRYPEFTMSLFEELDKDKNQKISKEELEHYIKETDKNICGINIISCNN